MTPKAQAMKADLDAILAKGRGPIDVTFGVALYDELCRAGHIAWGDFPNTAFDLNVPGAPRMLRLPSYGQPSGVVCAIPSREMPDPYDFLVGAGGITPLQPLSA